jgi:hypothetical protein
MMNRTLLFIVFLIAAGLGVGQVRAQLVLHGVTGADEATPPPTPRKTPKPPKTAKRTPVAASVGEDSLKLNGAQGELQLSSEPKGKNLTIEKLALAGEVVSNPAQKCRIEIVAQTPIEAVDQGKPDGLERYSADIPACPLTFDRIDGAVIVPTQTAACVFQAADCQASPSGVWGPDETALENDADRISKARAGAEASITASLKALQKRDKSAAAALAREQNDFAAHRDDVCRDYVDEAKYGFCATRLTQARAALLRRRVHPPKAKADGAED